jgi:hypothetical protein
MCWPSVALLVLRRRELYQEFQMQLEVWRSLSRAIWTDCPDGAQRAATLQAQLDAT